MANAWEKEWIRGDRIGGGGQGLTYTATHRADPTIKAALKCLRNKNSLQARGRMRREVANLEWLAKAGGAVPRVLGHNTESSDDPSVELYLVMDYIHGDMLNKYFSSHAPLSIERAVKFTLSLCETVRIAHTAPILHRDLKPENIIVRDAEKNDLVVVDYGLSFNASDEDLTQTEETFRNQFLDLPETNVSGGDHRDKRSDLAALSGILWFCLSGHKPGQLQDENGLLPHRRKGCSLREKRDDHRISAIEEFLDRGFAPVVANRFQTVEQMQERLREFLVSNKDLDMSDPFQLAAHLAAERRARDRVTQIAHFRRDAAELFQYLSTEVQKYANKLNGYAFRFANGYLPGTGTAVKEPPQGLELVEAWGMHFVLQANHHPYQRLRAYTVAARGEECVLLAANWKWTSNQPNMTREKVELSWEEVASYYGSPKPAFNLVSVNLRHWVTAQVRDLHQEIIPK